MAAYVKNAHGDWNNPSVWTPNGIPNSADTVTLGAFTTTVPAGYTAQCGGGTGTGTNTSTRCTLVIAGTLELYGNIQMEDWTTLSFAGTGTLDLRANSFIFNNNGSSGKRNELISDGTGLMRIRSSATIGHFGGVAGGQAYAKVSIDNFLIENTTFRCMSSWYPGHGVSVQNGVFYNCGRIETDSYVDDADDWIFENVDFRGSQAVEDQKAWIYCRDKGGTITGIRRFKNITFDYHGLANASLRVQFWPAILDVDTVAIRGCYIEAISPVLPTWYRLFSSKAGTIGEALPSIRHAVFSSTGDNPHALQNLLTDLQYFYLETQQPAGSSDAGDHFILPNGGTSLVRYGIINDNWGGACMNAIGASVTGSHTMEHCTIVADIHDAVYGIIARNENFGVFDPSASVTIRSNIAYARSNVGGFSNIRAINLETAGNDQIDILDNNLITGFGSLLSTIYHGVTYSSGGAVGTVVNRGLNDILNVDPQFVDETRNVQSWATQYGATDYDSAMIYVIDSVNGYNRTTHLQNGVVGYTLTDLLAYLREGYRPTNALLATAAHDGLTIGAIDFLPTEFDAFQSDAFQSDAFQSDNVGGDIYSVTGAGSLTFGGGAWASFAIAAKGAGQLSDGGSFKSKLISLQKSAGSLLLSGDAKISNLFSLKSSAQIVIGGAAKQRLISKNIAAGNISFAGAAKIRQISSYIGIGSVMAGGSAATSLNINTVTLSVVGSGGFIASGAAKLKTILLQKSVGQISAGGFSSFRFSFRNAGFGAVVIGGQTKTKFVFAGKSLGNYLFSGSTKNRFVYKSVSAGNIVILGAAKIRQLTSYVGVGGMVAGGTARASLAVSTVSFVAVGVGQFELSGGAHITLLPAINWYQNIYLTVYYRPLDRRVVAKPLDRTVKYRF